MGVTTPLYSHQQEALEHVLSQDHSALFMETGTGKTLVAISALVERDARRVLVVAPLTVCGSWLQELEQHTDHKIDAARWDGAEFSELPQVRVINPERAWRRRTEIDKWAPDMVIVDESHRIKSHVSKCSKGIHRIGARAQWRIIMTGTPITRSPLDLFGQFRFLDQSVLGTRFHAFRGRYAIMGGYAGKEVVGFRDLDHLWQLVDPLVYRCTKADALDLPEQVDVVVPVSMPMREYRELESESVLELESSTLTAPHALTLMMRLQQLTSGFLPDGEVWGRAAFSRRHSAKLEALRDQLQDRSEAGEKVVIFSRFREDVATCKTVALRLGLCAAHIDGSVSGEDRTKIIAAFQRGDIDVLSCQIATAGVGITLTAASVCIFYSVDFSLANYLQARDRIHRIGQDKKCTYIHLVCTGTIDEHVMESIKAKQDISTMLIDDIRQMIRSRK